MCGAVALWWECCVYQLNWVLHLCLQWGIQGKWPDLHRSVYFNAERANLGLCVNLMLCQYFRKSRCCSDNILHVITLLDIDECVEQSPCDSNAQCTNTLGSFTCACNEGYSGDGRTCTGQFNFSLAFYSAVFYCVYHMPPLWYGHRLSLYL